MPWVVVVMVVVMGMAALSVDLGRAMVIRRQLQVQADAAALAAAESLGGTTSYSTVGQDYSGASGDKNTNSGISVRHAHHHPALPFHGHELGNFLLFRQP